MKIVGLITEYNPFHKGHLYHIKKAKEITGADAALVLMSGDYVQRGEPAIFPKEVRARAALLEKASAVFELPLPYATGSGEIFATGAVSLFDALGCVDAICFGAECSDTDLLSEIARVLLEEPEEYQRALKSALKEGKSFPAAREKALVATMGEGETLKEILQNPNNILGIEYIKALKKLGSPMKAYAIEREGASYHELTLGWKYDSASSIRQALRQKQDLDLVRESIPKDVFEIYKDYLKEGSPIFWQDYSLLLKYRLMEVSSVLEDPHSGLSKYLDVSDQLAHRIINYLEEYLDPESFVQVLKTKDLNYTRISRSLLHIMLGIKNKDLEEYLDRGAVFYGRLLGFRKEDAKVLSAIKKNSKIPMLTKLADARQVLTDFYGEAGQGSEEKKDLAMRMLSQDVFASEIYDSVQKMKDGRRPVREFRKPIQIFEA